MTTPLSSQTLKTKHYQIDRQVEYLHLEAEVDLLEAKLTALKQQKQLLEEISTRSSESAVTDLK